jgi:hypothetical protein
MNQLTNLKSLILIPLALAYLSLTPKVVAFGIPLNCNTSDGFQALFNVTTGTDDTAVGGEALFRDTTGTDNTAIGCGALEFTVDGFENTATGSQALKSNTSGTFNTADGYQALFRNTTGTGNTATGIAALFSNNGFNNTANGNGALFSNTSGQTNTAVGFNALQRNTTGSDNIAVGTGAGFNLTTGNNNIYIGNGGGFPDESGTIRIGTQGSVDIGQTLTYIAGISDTFVPSESRPVIIGRDGQLGTVVSSARFKEEIKPMDKTSEVILALKPVTFRYKKELDPKGIPQFGLVAEEVEKVNPDLITRDRDGKPYTVRYEVVNAMLLNEFLKAHRKIEEQGALIAKQQKQIEALSAGLQKVSDKIEMTKPAPQVVINN